MFDTFFQYCMLSGGPYFTSKHYAEQW